MESNNALRYEIRMSYFGEAIYLRDSFKIQRQEKKNNRIKKTNLMWISNSK